LIVTAYIGRRDHTEDGFAGFKGGFRLGDGAATQICGEASRQNKTDDTAQNILLKLLGAGSEAISLRVHESVKQLEPAETAASR